MVLVSSRHGEGLPEVGEKGEFEMAQLTRWQPARELTRLRDEFDRMFDDWPRFLRRGAGDEEGLRGSWIPAVDIRETKDAIEVTAELPGIDAKDVDVSVQENVLTIRGERSREEVKEDETVHRIEREYGVFERSFTLPRSVEPEKIKAGYKDGVLSVSVPKREEAKPKAVKVEVSAK
jgi:HSP20 family protein